MAAPQAGPLDMTKIIPATSQGEWEIGRDAILRSARSQCIKDSQESGGHVGVKILFNAASGVAAAAKQVRPL